MLIVIYCNDFLECNYKQFRVLYEKHLQIYKSEQGFI